MTQSEQARADALADAETLRLFALQVVDYSPEGRCWLISETGRGLRDASDMAYLAIGGASDFASERAAMAARAAFRAVPELRG